jgi:hypothetical protein
MITMMTLVATHRGGERVALGCNWIVLGSELAILQAAEGRCPALGYWAAGLGSILAFRHMRIAIRLGDSFGFALDLGGCLEHRVVNLERSTEE